MKVLFISNYFNHHQKPFCDAMFKRLDGNFAFFETSVMREERKALGWEMQTIPSYVISLADFTERKNHYQTMIDEADVVIIGSAPEKYIRRRKRNGGLIFRYSERPLKKGLELPKYLPRLIKWNLKNISKKKICMLCASAYTASDYAKFGLFRNRCYKWGYFPEVKSYSDIDHLIEKKQPLSILWVARLIELKHPELPILVAKRLKDENYSFEMRLIGSGVLEEKIQNMIMDLGLNDCVQMLGTMKPEQVREHMENSQIFLFTSDRNEGWGAVLNEAMNSACAVVASHAIGSVPFLIYDGANGLIYRDGCIDDLYEKVKTLLDNGEECKRIGIKAYETIINEWNAENAAKKFLELVHWLSTGNESMDCFAEGVCSRAKILKDDWYINK